MIAQHGHGGRATFEDREGGFWVGTLTHGVEHYRDGRLTRYTARDGLASDRIQCLAQDAGGDVWVGTLRGLNRISSGRVVRFPGEDIFARKTIRALYLDPRGALWVGTLGSGLARISQGQASFITAHHGLPSDGIEQIVEDDATNLWLDISARNSNSPGTARCWCLPSSTSRKFRSSRGCRPESLRYRRQECLRHDASVRLRISVSAGTDEVRGWRRMDSEHAFGVLLGT